MTETRHSNRKIPSTLMEQLYGKEPESPSTSLTEEDRPTWEQHASDRDYDHVLKWSDTNRSYEIDQESRMFCEFVKPEGCTKANINNYNHNFSIVCNLCKSRQGKPSQFTTQHLVSDHHQKSLLTRSETMHVLRNIIASEDICPILPFPDRPWLILMRRFNRESQCWAAHIRCLACNDPTYDIILTRWDFALFENYDEVAESDEANQYCILQHEGYKHHKQCTWCFNNDHYESDEEAMRARNEVAIARNKLLIEDPQFYRLEAWKLTHKKRAEIGDTAAIRDFYENDEEFRAIRVFYEKENKEEKVGGIQANLGA